MPLVWRVGWPAPAPTAGCPRRCPTRAPPPGHARPAPAPGAPGQACRGRPAPPTGPETVAPCSPTRQVGVLAVAAGLAVAAPGQQVVLAMLAGHGVGIRPAPGITRHGLGQVGAD